MTRRGRIFSFTLILLLSFFASNTFVDAQTDPFYQGKQIRIIVGASAGGFYDRWARLLARFIPKYLLGNPSMIVQTMPGAGSLVATNYVYSLSKPDGLTLLMPNSNTYLEQLGSQGSPVRSAQVFGHRFSGKEFHAALYASRCSLQDDRRYH